MIMKRAITCLLFILTPHLFAQSTLTPLQSTSSSSTDITDEQWADDEYIGTINTTMGNTEDATDDINAVTYTAPAQAGEAGEGGEAGAATDALGANQVIIGSNQQALGEAIDTLGDNQAILATNQNTLQKGQKSIATKQSSGFTTTTSNQNTLKNNQNTMYQQANDNKIELMEQIQSMMDKDKLRGVMFGGGEDEENQDPDNFLVRLQDWLQNQGRDPSASANISDAATAMMSLLNDPKIKKAQSDYMQQSIALLFSGAGNKWGKNYFSVKDVVTDQPDAFGDSAGRYQSFIFPIMEDKQGDGLYVAASCDDRPIPSESTKDIGNLMIAVEYVRVLTASCSETFKVVCQNQGSGTQDGGSVPASGGVTLAEGSMPEGACGCTSNLSFVTDANRVWNGFPDLLDQIMVTYARCDTFASYNPGSNYKSLSDSVKNACTAFKTLVDDNNIQGWVNNDSDVRANFQDSAQAFLTNLKPKLLDIKKPLGSLIFYQIFNSINKEATSDAVKNYGSLSTLMGSTSYSENAAESFDDCKTIMSDYANDPSNFNVSVTQISDQSTGATTAQLAQLYINQSMNLTRQTVTLPVPNMNEVATDGGMAIAIHGKFQVFNSSGDAKLPSNSSMSIALTEPSKVKSNQDQNAVKLQSFQSTYRESMAPLILARLLALSNVNAPFLDRNILIQVTPKSGSSGSCSFTPAQAEEFYYGFRLDPSISFANADTEAVNAQALYDPATGEAAPLELASGNYMQQLQSSSSSEVQKEIAGLLVALTTISSKIARQNEQLNLLLSYNANNGIQTAISDLTARSLSLKQYADGFYKGSSVASPGGSEE